MTARWVVALPSATIHTGSARGRNHAGGPLATPVRGLVVAAALVASAVLTLALAAQSDWLPANPPGAEPVRDGSRPVALLLGEVALSLTVVTGVARLCGGLARRLGQPAVLGEIVGGVLLGPSVLGAWWPSARELVVSDRVVPYVALVAQAGLLLFMCSVGAEFQLPTRRVQSLTTVVGAAGVMAVPLALGVIVAAPLAGAFAGPGASPLAFAAFVGTALSVTAFPVLVRIIADTGLRGTAIGTLATLSAAVVDVLAWTALTVSLAILGHDLHTGIAWTFVLVAGLTVLSLLGLRPLLSRVVARRGDKLRRSGATLLVVVPLLALATATDALGAHAMFGAFLAGLALPRARPVARALRRMSGISRSILLPVFFAGVGMQVDLGRVAADSTALWGGVVLLVAAVVGKVGSAVVVGLSAGLRRRPALAFAVLMNARGATEVVVLSAGLAVGAINQTAYSVLVVIALLTTVMVTPCLRLLRPLDEEAAATINPLPKGRQ